MSRLGIEQVTAERLQRANSLSLKSPVDGERTFDGTGDSLAATAREILTGTTTEGHTKEGEGYVNQSDGASDDSVNPATLRNERYAVLTNGGSSTTGGRNSSTGSTGRVGNLSGSVSSTDTVIRRPASVAREGSVHSGDLSQLSRETVYPVVQAHERYRGTSYTLDSGFVGPRALCMGISEEGLGPCSSGLSIRPNTGVETIASRGKLSNRGSYRAPDGGYSTSRTDQDRRPSGGGQFQVPGRRVHSGPLAPRSSSHGFPTVPHHPAHRKGSSGGSSYTYGLGGRTNQRIQPHDRSRSTGKAYGSVTRYGGPRLHPSGRQPYGSVPEGAARLPPGSQEYEPGETWDHVKHQRQQSWGEFSGSSDPKYRRPQSRAESFHGERVGPTARGQNMEEPPVRDEVAPAGGEQLAQKARELFNRACANLPQPMSAPEGPVNFNSGAQELGESCLDSVARAIEHLSLPGAVDSEEVPKVAKIPKVDTTKSLHWSRKEFPEDDSPQSPIGDGQTEGVKRGNVRTGWTASTSERFLLDNDDLPESNPTIYDRVCEGSANQASSPVRVGDWGLLDIWLPTSSPQVGESSNRLGPRLMENDNPHAPVGGLSGPIANESAESREMNGKTRKMA